MAALFPPRGNGHSDGMVGCSFRKENTDFMSVCAPLLCADQFLRYSRT